MSRLVTQISTEKKSKVNSHTHTHTPNRSLWVSIVGTPRKRESEKRFSNVNCKQYENIKDKYKNGCYRFK